ncbi:hypothetical protein TpMuguga_03g00263 [Theileria parva strain Muguga]|uniref:Peptidase A1 domain-containing protein n=1 Tax=Theileria parva TaxID=5875 RepID=Q4N088_THEPA|nr:uncharacterized protein TpMuguga_03g00263 [Theileria parva strain Muguga]EAN30998.1 hypothetical protein TpMuguga_03g00263 [Theileria parva strain Muguga]|eukprot:XP_763281.1 hypothetical protein [Theileria parva strain Muguga]
MKNLFLLYIILPICLVESNDPKILNLAAKEFPGFHVTEIPHPNYRHLQFELSSESMITAVVDSGSDIWIAEESEKSFLFRAHVYVKNKVAHLVELKIYVSNIDITKYYVREDGGKFKHTNQDIFNDLKQTDVYFCGDLILDFERGFGFHFFKKEKIVVFGQDFIKFVPSIGLDVVKLTNGKDVICDSSKNRTFSYAIYFYRPGVDEMIKVVVEDANKDHVYFYFQFSKNRWIRSGPAMLEHYYKTPQPSAVATGSLLPVTIKDEKAEDKLEVYETTPKPESSKSLALPYSVDKFEDTGAVEPFTKKIVSDHLVLTLETALDDPNFDASDTTYANGLIFRFVLPNVQNLKEIRCNSFHCKVDGVTEVSYDLVSAYLYKDVFHLIKIVLTNIYGSTEEDYIRVCDSSYIKKTQYHLYTDRLTKADHDSLSDPAFLAKSEGDLSIPDDSSERLIEFDLESDEVQFLKITKIDEVNKNPCRIYKPNDGFFIGKISHKKKVLWRAYLKNERATKGTLYFLNGEPGFLNLIIPGLPRPDNNITIDVISGKKTPNLVSGVLSRVIRKYDSEFCICFNLTDPIDYTAFDIDKQQHRCFVSRIFKAGSPIVSVYHHKEKVTPNNIIPFYDIKVYYYQRAPISFVTDHASYPRVFINAASGWRTSNLSSLESDLDDIKGYLDGPHMRSSLSLYLSYEDYDPTDFEVEVTIRSQIISKTFMPTFKNLITLITCNDAHVYGSDSLKSSGVRFYLKNEKPYKAEVHKFIREGVHKLIFKVYDETGDKPKWKDIDEDDFTRL